VSFVTAPPVELVVVLAGQIGEVYNYFLTFGSVDAEVIPVSLAVPFVLIDIASQMTAEMSRADRLDALQASSFEAGVNDLDSGEEGD
jgi:hypothetical protein